MIELRGRDKAHFFQPREKVLVWRPVEEIRDGDVVAGFGRVTVRRLEEVSELTEATPATDERAA